MIDNSKEAVNGAVAVKALSTVKVYCVTHFCPECPLREDLEKYNSCPIPKLDVKTGVGFFKDTVGKRAPEPPKFDGSLQLSPEFRAYLTSVLDRALDNCFASPFSAWLHITSVKRSIRHLADALRLTPPGPKKDGD